MFEINSLFYSGSDTDRMGHLRKDEDELTSLINSNKARVIPFWRKLHWIADNEVREYERISIESNGLYDYGTEPVFLGIHQTIPFFALDFSHYDETEALEVLRGGRFADLRNTRELKYSTLASMLAYTRALMFWHNSNGFCNRCGSATTSAQAGHVRICSACDHIIYPRTDSAVIVLIEYRPEKGEPLCLLGRHRDRPQHMYSTFAGFVEVGERLEETVRREMMEEVGLPVNNIRYITSQPWPFPSSLMLGFYAQASSKDFKLDQDEVNEARWLTPSEIVDLVGKNKLILSREDSIARFLIQRWVNENLSV